MANKNLGAARKAKQDEFYTQWDDIEREMNAYLEYDPDVFRGKTVLLPCDDPEWSNFAKYFALNFTEYGLKKLIATSYAPASNPAIDEYKPTLFELESPQYDETKSRERGRLFVLDGTDVNHDGKVNIDDLRWTYLDGDGDFRSDEVTALRDEADIVVTNPPFSLFREFLAWLASSNVQFSIIGNMNAVTYRDVFARVKNDKLWYGPSISSGDREFRVPDSYPLNAAGFRVSETGERFIRVKGVRWFTNIEHGRRHEPLQLMTMEDNLKFSKHAAIRQGGYPRYDNFDAINVSFTDAIPSDYDGVMGVPISFLDKYSPEQFEIKGITTSYDSQQTKRYPKQVQVSAGGGRKEVGKLNDAPAIKVEVPPQGKTYYEVDGGTYVLSYHRILIRRRNPVTPGA